MPQPKAKDLRALTIDELREKFESLKKELFQLRVQAKLQKLTNVSSIRLVRRQAAKVSTVIRELETRKSNG